MTTWRDASTFTEPFPASAVWFDSAGRARELGAEGSRHEPGFAWFHVTNPSGAEISKFGDLLDLHPVSTRDLAHGWQRPKLERYDGFAYLMVWDLDRTNGSVPSESGELALYYSADWLFTVQRGDPDRLRDLRVVLEEPGEVATSSPLGAVYRILDAIVQDFVAAGASIEKELNAIEAEVFDQDVKEDHLRVYRLRQSIARVDRAATGVAAALESGSDEFERLMGDDQQLAPYLRHLYNDTVGVSALATDQHQALDAVVASHESNVAFRQNKDMRTISAFAALLAVPTVVAGLYGMNFKNLPLVHWQYGWLVIGAAIVVVDAFAYFAFKRRGWL